MWNSQNLERESQAQVVIYFLKSYHKEMSIRFKLICLSREYTVNTKLKYKRGSKDEKIGKNKYKLKKYKDAWLIDINYQLNIFGHIYQLKYIFIIILNISY